MARFLIPDSAAPVASSVKAIARHNATTLTTARVMYSGVTTTTEEKKKTRRRLVTEQIVNGEKTGRTVLVNVSTEHVLDLLDKSVRLESEVDKLDRASLNGTSFDMKRHSSKPSINNSVDRQDNLKSEQEGAGKNNAEISTITSDREKQVTKATRSSGGESHVIRKGEEGANPTIGDTQKVFRQLLAERTDSFGDVVGVIAGSLSATKDNNRPDHEVRLKGAVIAARMAGVMGPEMKYRAEEDARNRELHIEESRIKAAIDAKGEGNGVREFMALVKGVKLEGEISDKDNSLIFPKAGGQSQPVLKQYVTRIDYTDSGEPVAVKEEIE